MACECLYIEWVGAVPGSGEFDPAGLYNDESYWEISIDGTPYFIFWNGAQWTFSDSLGGVAILVSKAKKDQCPCTTTWQTPPETPIFPYEIITGECGWNCCFDLSLIDIFQHSYQLNLNMSNKAGFYNCKPWWKFELAPFWYNITFQGEDELGRCIWLLSQTDAEPKPGEGSDQAILYQSPCGCPISNNWQLFEGGSVTYFATADCSVGCIPMQERIFREYQSIKLPEIFEEEDRGFFKCCCPFIVLASQTSDSWKNDVTSAWVKLSGQADTYEFILKKNGVVTNYIPTSQAFIKEENAFYTTIPWKDVLASDGAGCYTLEVIQNISGINLAYTWGTYYLKPYTTENALKTARIRVIFNSYQEIEDINFAGSQVEDTFRFYGYIGNRQPNMEIDNLIYQNREVKKVIRENLNQWEIITDPLCDEFIRRLTDLYLLSENKLFISDYNAHNPSYRINDIPVIVEESPEIEYYDFSREASLTCIVGDKFKNKRSYYGGN